MQIGHTGNDGTCGYFCTIRDRVGRNPRDQIAFDFNQHIALPAIGQQRLFSEKSLNRHRSDEHSKLPTMPLNAPCRMSAVAASISGLSRRS